MACRRRWLARSKTRDRGGTMQVAVSMPDNHRIDHPHQLIELSCTHQPRRKCV